MLTTNISEKIRYIGVNDRRTQRFEAMWPLPYGISYNSYLIRGEEKSAIIDGVEISKGLLQIEEIKDFLGDKAPDYLIINHMEPDHSGAIRLLRSAFPNITIVGNRQTLSMLEGYYGLDDNTLTVKDGDTLSLGADTTLKFFLTPMVHWPETMMTLLAEENVLFSGDAFGCYGALNGAVLDYQMNTDIYFPEMERYYANIVGKYGTFVQRAIKKLQGTEIALIAPTHGPVWSEKSPGVIDLYDRLSRYEPLDKEGVTIIYGSMYGNMEHLVEKAAEALAEHGIRKISIHNASFSELSYMITDVFRNRGLIIAAPTYSDGLFPPVRAAVEAIAVRGVKDRIMNVMTTCTWAERASSVIDSILTPADISLLDPPVIMKQSATPADIENCRAAATHLAETLLS